MSELLNMEFNLFVMIALGYIARKLKIVSERAMGDLTNLVIYIILPCTIFKSFIGQQLSDLAADCVAVLLVSCGIQISGVIYGKLAFPKQSPERRCSLAYGMICSNAGFLGNAIAESVFGPVGLMLASIYLIPQRIMMWSEGIAIYSGVSDKKAAAKKVLTHPCVIACILGLIAMAANAPIPAAVMAPIKSVGACTTPLSMIVIGFVLSGIDLKKLVDRTVAEFTVHRLILAPLAVLLVCKLLPISDSVRGLSVLLVAMPAGATTTMLSAKYDRDPEFATKLVVFSTLCSIPAILIWSMILKG